MFDITRPSFLLLIMVVVFGSSLLLESVTAAPTTGAASLISSNNATFTMTGAGTVCWFEWGMQTGDDMTWKTTNATPAAGVCTLTVRGSPYIGGEVFYYRACDETGCGASATFTPPKVTPIPTSTYGSTFENLTQNNFDITLIGGATMAPYMWLLPTFQSLIWGLIFMFIFIGLWLRGREIGTVTILGFIVGVLLFSPTYGLDIGIPQEFAAIGQGIAYSCIAGYVLHLIKK